MIKEKKRIREHSKNKNTSLKPNSTSEIIGINTWVVFQRGYSGPFLNWTREELRNVDIRTRKLVSRYKALHPRDDIDRLYVTRKEGGR